MSVTPADVSVYSSLCDPAYDGAATLNGAVGTTSVATIPINTPTVPFPATGEFAIQVDSEVMWVTQGAPGGTAGTLTVIRGFGGTTAATHSSLAAVTMPIGLGVDFLSKLSFADITAGDLADYVSSSSSDTKPIIEVGGRDSTGVFKTETKTLNGTTIVNGTQAWDRWEYAKPSANTTITNAPLTSGGTSITIASATNTPASGTYFAQLGKEIVQVTAGQSTTTLTVTRAQLGTTAVAHQSGDNFYVLGLGDIAVLDHTKVITNHTMQTGSAQASGTTPPLAKLQSGDGASVSIGQIIRTLAGTGPNQIRTIIATTGYGTDFVAVSRAWGTLPDNTTTYDIWNGMQLDLAPNQITEVHRVLWNAAADIPGGSTKTFYQKGYVVNNNTVTALTGASVQIASNTPALPGTSAIDIALATSLNDVVSAVNRQTNLGSGYSAFVVQPAAVNVTANSGNLPSGAAPNAAGVQGILFRTTLPAGTAAYKGYSDVRTLGTTI